MVLLTQYSLIRTEVPIETGSTHLRSGECQCTNPFALSAYGMSDCRFLASATIHRLPQSTRTPTLMDQVELFLAPSLSTSLTSRLLFHPTLPVLCCGGRLSPLIGGVWTSQPLHLAGTASGCKTKCLPHSSASASLSRLRSPSGWLEAKALPALLAVGPIVARSLSQNLPLSFDASSSGLLAATPGTSQ